MFDTSTYTFHVNLDNTLSFAFTVDFANLPLLDGVSTIAASFYSQLIKQLVVFALIRKRMVAMYALTTQGFFFKILI